MPIVPKPVSPAMVVTFGGHLLAQSDSRRAEIAAQADGPNKVERRMLWFRGKDPLGRFPTGAAGFCPRPGSPGAGAVSTGRHSDPAVEEWIALNG